MLRALLAIIIVFLIVPGCDDDETIVTVPEIHASDLIGAWKGTLPGYYVNNGISAESYNLQELRCSLILGEQTYWFELGYYSDSLDFSFVSKGYWQLFEGRPPDLYFQVREEWSNQKFKGLDEENNEIILDMISSHNGDGSSEVGEWQCLIELEDGELRIFDFIGYSNLGEEIFLTFQ